MRQSRILADARYWRLVRAAVFIGLFFTAGAAQQVDTQVAVSGSKPNVVSDGAVDGRYRLGPGDLISIATADYPQLSSESVRVDNQGMILAPMLNEEIQAACHTESELAQELTKRYLKYLKDPLVRVFVKEYHSQPVAVIGAVRSPGRFQLQRRLRLLELLTFVSGPSEKAGQSIQIIHAGSGPACGEGGGGDESAVSQLVTLNLKSTMKAEESANPFVRPGDIVTVPEADQYYVIGNVARPSAYTISGQIGIVQAIAVAGGLLPDSKTDHIRILRQVPGSSVPTEIFLDLKAARKPVGDEFILQANDVVEVERKGGFGVAFKNAFRNVLPAMTTSLPYMIIP